MIELKNISKSYTMGGQVFYALKNINLKIDEGDFVAIMGSSGSGKSTMMNILGLLDTPTNGSYFLYNSDISKLSEDNLAKMRRDKIGFVFQQFNLLPRISAWENVSLPLLYTDHKLDFERAKYLLSRVGLNKKLYNLPNELSGGQQQRVAIARALINNPKIIFADEPTGNLDSVSEKEIIQILRDLNNQGITIVLVTHEDDVAQHANRIIHIRDGEIISDERKKSFSAVYDKENFVDRSTTKNNIIFEWVNYFKQGFKSLTANKIRTFLSTLGILIGVASVVTMLAIGNGAQSVIENELKSLGSNLLLVRPGVRRVGSVAGSGAAVKMTIDDVTYVKNELPVKDVSAVVGGSAQVTYHDKNLPVMIDGVSASYHRIHSSTPTVGRFFTESENTSRERVAVIGYTLIKSIFDGKNPIGEIIKINKIPFTVIGIIPKRGSNSFRDQAPIIIIPVNTAIKRLTGREHISGMEVEAINAESVNRLQYDLKQVLLKKYKIPLSQQKDAVRIHNLADIKKTMETTSNTFSLLLTIIAGISLIVGGIGIMNIMLVSITERTREIGLRKSVGAKRSDILAQFLFESVVISFVGGMLGIISAWIVIKVLSLITGWTTIISIGSIIFSVMFSVTIGLIFGIYPAMKASKLNPIDALRHD